jgi:hypothetical protein
MSGVDHAAGESCSKIFHSGEVKYILYNIYNKLIIYIFPQLTSV